MALYTQVHYFMCYSSNQATRLGLEHCNMVAAFPGRGVDNITRKWKSAGAPVFHILSMQTKEQKTKAWEQGCVWEWALANYG